MPGSLLAEAAAEVVGTVVGEVATGAIELVTESAPPRWRLWLRRIGAGLCILMTVALVAGGIGLLLANWL